MDARFERYRRQVVLPVVGEEGQRRLAESSALLVGCGALGTAIAEALVRAGVGRLIIVDRDYVEHSNLQRQVLFDEADARDRVPKAIAAQRKLLAINPLVHVEAVVGDVHAGNVEALAGVGGCGPDASCEAHSASAWGGVEVLLDGTDNFETRYLLNDVSVKHGVPYVYGGVVGTAGTGFVVLPRFDGARPWEVLGLASPDLRDLWELMPAPGSVETCETAGVLGPAVSAVSAFQSAEALKVLMGRWDAVCRKLLHVDVWQNRWGLLGVEGAYEASSGVTSKQRRFEFLEGSAMAGKVLTLCGRGAVQVSPGVVFEAELTAVEARWRAGGLLPRCNGYLLHAALPDDAQASEMTLFADGRLLVKGTAEPAVARSIYARWVGS